MIRLVLGLLAGLAFGYALVVALNKQSEAAPILSAANSRVS
jgi:hypothetical protein